MTSTQQNNLLTRHPRVVLCEVCEHSPAVVTCKADAASLCGTCDLDIHSANPLASRHVRVPILHSYDSEEEAEAATWLLPDPNNNNNNNNNDDHLDDDESELPVYKSAEYLFSDVDPYLDLGLVSGQGKMNRVVRDEEEEEEKRYCCDRAVPEQNVHEYGSGQGQGLDPVVDGYPTYEVDYSGSKPLIMYNFTSQSISRTVSCSSLDVGVVPDHNAMTDVSNGYIKPEALPTPLSGVDREARVLRYKEKRKNRKFIKTIRYASRKAYAEIRPRIKGRFAKRNENDVDSLVAADGSYGVVPTF